MTHRDATHDAAVFAAFYVSKWQTEKSRIQRRSLSWLGAAEAETKSGKILSLRDPNETLNSQLGPRHELGKI